MMRNNRKHIFIRNQPVQASLGEDCADQCALDKPHITVADIELPHTPERFQPNRSNRPAVQHHKRQQRGEYRQP